MTINDFLREQRAGHHVRLFVHPIMPGRSYALYIETIDGSGKATKVACVESIVLTDRNINDYRSEYPPAATLSHDQAVELLGSLKQCHLEQPKSDDVAIDILQKHIEQLNGWMGRFVEHVTK